MNKNIYDDYSFGDFNYQRENDSPLLKSLLYNTAYLKGTILDVGCGDGYYLNLINKIDKNLETLGIDLSQNSIDYAKKRFGLKNIKLGDNQDIPLDSNFANLSISNGVIHHCNDPSAAFKELIRVTKKNHYIYLSVYNVFNPYYWIIYKSTFLVRFLYWKVSKKFFYLFFPLFYAIFYMLIRIFSSAKPKAYEIKKIFSDQVLTKNAHLFSYKRIQKLCSLNNATIEDFGFSKLKLLLCFVIKKND